MGVEAGVPVGEFTKADDRYTLATLKAAARIREIRMILDRRISMEAPGLNYPACHHTVISGFSNQRNRKGG
jgi:hypothetical protein